MKQIVIHNIYEQLNHSFHFFHPSSPYNRDDSLLPYRYLKEQLATIGYNLVTIDEGDALSCDYLLFFDMPSFIPNLPNPYFMKYLTTEAFRRKMLLVLWEPPIVNEHNWNLEYHRHFNRIFTWSDDLTDLASYVKIQFPQSDSRYPRRSFQQKKLCALMNSNLQSPHILELYSERRRAIHYFEKNHPDDFDLYGNLWRSEDNPSYRGRAEDKGETLSQYKFAICYENAQAINGYITEKIFDCFRSSCIPIYLGAPNIEQYVPADTFIDFRSFADYEALYTYLINISEADHEAYLDRIEQFLQSDAFTSHYTKEAFSKVIVDQLIELDQT
ncbi:Glycosyltransferase family 10 (fucosyltransferase) [compost metagenome]